MFVFCHCSVTYVCVICADYETKVADANYTECENGSRPGDHQVCEFNMTDLGSDCTEANQFGYANGTPCVLLKINKVSFC